jgi:exonuclease SbcC
MLGNSTKLLEALRTQKKEYNEKLTKLSSELGLLESFESSYQIIVKELEKLYEEKLKVSNELSGLKKEVALLGNEIENLEKLAEELKRLEKEEKEFREKLELYSILKDSIFHKKGLAMYAIEKLLPTLAEETSKNLVELTDNKLNNVRITSYESRKEYGIKIEVLGVDDNWHEIQEFSGGEKTQINASLRFAIAKELALLPHVGKSYGRMKTLFIDEGDLGSLDTEVSRELFVRKLFAMGNLFDKIVLITHLTDVAERFPAKIHVVMTPDGRSQIEY